MSEKSAPSRDHLVNDAHSAEPETLCPSQRKVPDLTATGCGYSKRAAKKRVSDLGSAKCRLFILQTYILSHLKPAPKNELTKNQAKLRKARKQHKFYIP